MQPAALIRACWGPTPLLAGQQLREWQWPVVSHTAPGQGRYGTRRLYQAPISHLWKDRQLDLPGAGSAMGFDV